MRAVIVGFLVLFAGFAAAPVPSPALAQEGCRCQGCGCKGGPGWRGPNGYCVSERNLTRVCGSPPGEPCKHEGVAQTCPRQSAALAETPAPAEAQ